MLPCPFPVVNLKRLRRPACTSADLFPTDPQNVCLGRDSCRPAGQSMQGRQQLRMLALQQALLDQDIVVGCTWWELGSILARGLRRTAVRTAQGGAAERLLERTAIMLLIADGVHYSDDVVVFHTLNFNRSSAPVRRLTLKDFATNGVTFPPCLLFLSSEDLSAVNLLHACSLTPPHSLHSRITLTSPSTHTSPDPSPPSIILLP